METTSPYASPGPPEVEQDPLVGKVVAGRYKVLKKMGEGGMGTVYLAEHITIEKKVALKVLLHEYARKADLKERFLREAKAAASIGHENIIDITDFGDTPDGSVFFAMEFLEGGDLSHAIKRDGPMPWSRAKPILLQICRALGAAHAKHIIHRDMKPENIFIIEREGRPDFVKVLDFGIAKVSGIGDTEHRLTRTGMIFGTPEYMSPEQAQGHLPDHRVDIYAVGVIMYELLTGVVPFKADTFMGILTKHIFENPVPPTQLKPELQIPVEAEACVLKAMAKDREERFSSLAEMAAAIQGVSNRLTRSTADHAAPLPKMRTPGPGSQAATVGPRAISGIPGGRVVEPVDTGPTESFAPNRGKMIGIILAVVLLVGGGIAAAVVLRGGDEKGNGAGSGSAGAGSGSAGAGSGSAGAGSGSAGAGSGSAGSAGAGSGTTAQPGTTVITIKLRSDPPGASVYKGVLAVGQTPVDYKVEKNEKSSLLFTFKLPGHEDARESIVPAAGAELRVKLTPTAVAVPTAGTGKTPSKVKKPRKPKGKINWPKGRTDKPNVDKPKIDKPKIDKPKIDNRLDRSDLKDPFAK